MFSLEMVISKVLALNYPSSLRWFLSLVSFKLAEIFPKEFLIYLEVDPYATPVVLLYAVGFKMLSLEVLFPRLIFSLVI